MATMCGWALLDPPIAVAIQGAIDVGVNLIDTAPAYGAGHAEEVVGRAIRGRRDKVVVATKCGVKRTKDDFIRTLEPQSLYHEIDDSLRRLGVETIDLWQIHWPDPKTPLEEALEAILKIKEQGKFRYLGVSNFDIPLMKQARESLPFHGDGPGGRLAPQAHSWHPPCLGSCPGPAGSPDRPVPFGVKAHRPPRLVMGGAR